jgi:hypothetical protein
VHWCTAEGVQRCKASCASPQAPSQACVCPACFALIKVVGRVAELAAPQLAAQLPAARLEGEVDEVHVVAGHKGRPTESGEDEPPVLGLIRRGGGVVLRLLADVRQATIRPIIDEGNVAKGAVVRTDEHDVYARRAEWGTAARPRAMPGASTRATRTATGSEGDVPPPLLTRRQRRAWRYAYDRDHQLLA